MILLRIVITILVYLIMIQAACAASPASLDSLDDDPSFSASLVASTRLPESLFFLGSPVPVHVQDVRERLEKELLLALWDRPQVILWIKRASTYFPHVEEILKQEGLPDDLKYMAVVESGLRPHAGSSDGAVGFWQFVQSTGRNNGLRIDSNIDERRNLFKSTRAACLYIKSLYPIFQSWPLALAAYNMGENGLLREMKLQDARDYYSLYLSQETQRYLFKIIAAKLIMESPAKFGFNFLQQDYYPLLTFDSIKVDSPDTIPLTVLAAAAGVTFKDIKDLNPEIRGYYLGRGQSTLLLPKGSAAAFQKAFPARLEKWRQENDKRVHVVKPGESLSIIASTYKISLSLLLTWNNLKLNSKIHPGEVLLVHPD
ncbi:MAG: transglycosylase SLT domain-containing protein [Pseudomonadota bacterium]